MAKARALSSRVLLMESTPVTAFPGGVASSTLSFTANLAFATTTSGLLFGILFWRVRTPSSSMLRKCSQLRCSYVAPGGTRLFVTFPKVYNEGRSASEAGLGIPLSTAEVSMAREFATPTLALGASESPVVRLSISALQTSLAMAHNFLKAPESSETLYSDHGMPGSRSKTCTTPSSPLYAAFGSKVRRRMSSRSSCFGTLYARASKFAIPCVPRTKKSDSETLNRMAAFVKAEGNVACVDIAFPLSLQSYPAAPELSLENGCSNTVIPNDLPQRKTAQSQGRGGVYITTPPLLTRSWVHFGRPPSVFTAQLWNAQRCCTWSDPSILQRLLHLSFPVPWSSATLQEHRWSHPTFPKHLMQSPALSCPSALISSKRPRAPHLGTGLADPKASSLLCAKRRWSFEEAVGLATITKDATIASSPSDSSSGSNVASTGGGNTAFPSTSFFYPSQLENRCGGSGTTSSSTTFTSTSSRRWWISFGSTDSCDSASTISMSGRPFSKHLS